MAQGDVVNGTLTATGSFQPAANVDIVINFLSGTGANDIWCLKTGASIAFLVPASTTLPQGIRVCLNNTIYLYYNKATLNASYGGYQTK